LVKKDNPYAAENINSVIACSVTVSAIYFLVVGNGDYATTDTRFQKRVSVAVEKARLDNENINAAISNISIVITKVNEQDP
jgi:cell division protein FtsX